MIIDTKQMVTVTEANQNFSKVTRIADNNEQAVILKNGKPQYLLINIEENPVLPLTDDEKIDIMSKRIFDKYRTAYEVLAK